MPVLIAMLGDITDQDADAIVNAANSAMRGGGGVDGAIHRRGGPAILRDCIERFPHGLAAGDAGWTTAGDLRARWVIHTVGPNYAAGQRDRSLLESCYRRSLEVAEELGARTVAFPLISAGIYGWPKHDAIAAAVETLAASDTRVDEVRLVAFDQATYEEIQAALARWTPVRILQGVRELHRRGYHRLRVLPGLSRTGLSWRVSLFSAETARYSADDRVPEGLNPIQYSTAAFTRFGGGNVTVTSSPSDVAELILAAMPGLAATGDDPGYVAWYADLMRLVEREGKRPVAYGEDFDDSSGWEVGWGSGVRHPEPPQSPRIQPVEGAAT